MRRALVLAASLMLGGGGVALADSPAPAPAPSNGTTDIYQVSIGQGRLGVEILGLTDELKQYFGAGKDGVLVGKVERGSPAQQAGVQVGDVIRDVDGKAIDDATDVMAELGGKKKGTPIALTIIRDHLPITLTAKLAADAPAFQPHAMANDLDKDPFFRDLGNPSMFGDLQQRIDRLEQRMHDLDHK